MIFNSLSWVALIILTLTITHITILTVTLWLHRACAHRSATFHPYLAYFFRFWSWFSTGMSTLQWGAIHRKHHAKCETKDDPHSPQIEGLANVFFFGVRYYQKESQNNETIKNFGTGLPNDKLEQFFIKYSWLGIFLNLSLSLFFFQPVDAIILWVTQMIWIPLWAAGVINGIGHYWGYRNFESADQSRNIFPWGILIGGEELHNNHHAYPTSARLSSRPWEFDWGYAVLCFLSKIKLAQILRVAPRVSLKEEIMIQDLNLEHLKEVLHTKVAHFKTLKNLLVPELKERTSHYFNKKSEQKVFYAWLLHLHHTAQISSELRIKFETIIKNDVFLFKIKSLIDQFIIIINDKKASYEQILHNLKQWHLSISDTNIDVMTHFSLYLRSSYIKQV